METHSAPEIVRKWLEALREKKKGESFYSSLVDFPAAELQGQLAPPQTRKAFWINFYNASIQYRLKTDDKVYWPDEIAREKFINIAGEELCPNEIYQRVLNKQGRRSTPGLLPKVHHDVLSPGLCLEERDLRIHFVLNHATEDSPPVAIYEEDKLENQMDDVTRIYLLNNTKYADSKAEVSPVFKWFRHDFGGYNGILAFLKYYGALPEDSRPQLSFKPYNWKIKGDYFRWFDPNLSPEGPAFMLGQ